MKKLLRKLRGMFGLGAIWAVIWTPIGLGIVLVQMRVAGLWPPPQGILLPLTLSGAKNGFLAGFLFAGALGLVYRRRDFAALRAGPMGVIGGLVGMLLPAGTMIATALAGSFVPPPLTVAMALGFGGALGAATAIGSLKLAQAAPTELGAGSVEALKP